MAVIDPTQIRATEHGTWLRTLSQAIRGLYTFTAGNEYITLGTALQITTDPAGTPVANTLYRGYGRLVLLSTQVITVAVATVDESAMLTSKYSRYIWMGTRVVPATDNVDAFLRVESGGSVKSGAADYGWAHSVVTATPAAADNGDNSDSEITMGLAVGSDTGEAMDFVVQIGDPSDTTLYKQIMFDQGNRSAAALVVRAMGNGQYIGATAAITGLQFLFSSGNVESGIFSLYAVADE